MAQYRVEDTTTGEVITGPADYLADKLGYQDGRPYSKKLIYDYAIGKWLLNHKYRITQIPEEKKKKSAPLSISEIDKLARMEGLSYGQYIAKYGI